jgi:hypothetical protein
MCVVEQPIVDHREQRTREGADSSIADLEACARIPVADVLELKRTVDGAKPPTAKSRGRENVGHTDRTPAVRVGLCTPYTEDLPENWRGPLR